MHTCAHFCYIFPQALCFWIYVQFISMWLMVAWIWQARRNGQHGVQLSHCSNMTIQDTTLYMAGLFAFLETSSQDSSFVGNLLMPYPLYGPSGPIGNGSQAALLSSNADGLHISESGYGHYIAGRCS